MSYRNNTKQCQQNISAGLIMRFIQTHKLPET
uniref:Uncharacterized protein n=1 Tax=Anguilla anguilla TaxID=7936 RepID=A0A0E9ULN3_ANGAN